ncbi:hypothetical protein CYY_002609 [Polysphondylium violaceum]|uniref:Uncharacterized protein n=1 Tax=Polysphondylium violaceum TaxID=133409 RepID=A0A8J4V0Q5_9MYCE|nr:hypothetical protein CYY_002609 [Polysphondylium violaceum]
MKLIITLLVLFLISIGYTRADTYSVVIWNNGTSVNVGLADVTSGNQAQLKLTLQDFYYQNPVIQSSTYNYATKLLSFYTFQISNRIPTLFVVDCNSWTVVSKTTYNSVFLYGGLASTNTPDNNVFTTYTDNSYIYVARLDSSQNIVKFDAVYGSYRGSVYVPTIDSYYVAFTNKTGLYVRIYNSNYQLSSEAAFGFSNNRYPVNDFPLNLVYDAKNNGVLAQVSMTDSRNNLYYALAYLDWNNNTFDVTNMYGNLKDRFTTTVPDSNNLDYAYTFAYLNFGATNLYIFNTATNTFVSSRPYNTLVLSAF